MNLSMYLDACRGHVYPQMPIAPPPVSPSNTAAEAVVRRRAEKGNWARGGQPAKDLPQPPNCLHFQDLCLWTLNTGRGNCVGCTARSSKSSRPDPYAAGGRCVRAVAGRRYSSLLSICKVCLRTCSVVELRRPTNTCTTLEWRVG